MEMINQLFRKKQTQNYRFSESRIRNRIVTLFGDEVKKSPLRMDSFDEEDSTFDRQPSTISPKKKQKKMRHINLTKQSSPIKSKKISPRNLSKSVKKDPESPTRFANSSYQATDSGSSMVKKSKDGYGYKHYTLGSNYHLVKKSIVSCDFTPSILI